MKSYLVLLFVVIGVTLANPSRDSSRTGTGGSRGSGSSGSGSDRWGSGSSSSARGMKCQWIRGHVKCTDPATSKHDKNTVVVRLADSRKTYDEAYTSQNGQFQVFGCDSSSLFTPELHVLHFCKANQARRIKLHVPAGSGAEWNITQVIDLKAFNADEQAYNDNIQLPCVP